MIEGERVESGKQGRNANHKDLKSEITYFRYSGENNSEKVLALGRKRAEERGITKVIVASETGRSVLKAMDIFKGSGIKIVAVTHYPDFTCGPKGDIPIGIHREQYEKRMKEIESAGIEIVQGTRPFVPPIRREWSWNGMAGMVDYTLEIFGSGTKVAVEVAIMATDAGKTDPGEEVISIGGTFKGLDTALLVKTAFSHRFFDEFEVREIIAKPRYLVHADGQYSDENWKGDLEQYYK